MLRYVVNNEIFIYFGILLVLVRELISTNIPSVRPLQPALKLSNNVKITRGIYGAFTKVTK